MLDRKERQWLTAKDVVATAEMTSAPRMKKVLFIAIVPLMDTESAMLNALSIGADDGKKTANGTEKGKHNFDVLRKEDKP